MCAVPVRRSVTHERLREAVLRGLRGSPRTLPPALLLVHDVRGAGLQARVTELPEYYLLRAEMEILRARVGEIARMLGPRVALIEFGGACGPRLRLLLDALDAPAAYVPVDVSGAQLAESCAEVDEAYPKLPVVPVWADYTAPFTMPGFSTGMRMVGYLPGSAIGRVPPAEATALLRRLRTSLGPSGALVIGVDLRKDPRVLHAAYNDSAGVTAAINLNQLSRLNRELGADFDVTRFRHYAFYEPVSGRVELHLVSLARQTVTIGAERIELERAETIWTASEYKYSLASLTMLAESAGFRMSKLWTDGGEGFAVGVLE
jgi:dimethylhistidine N-methyltransferase